MPTVTIEGATGPWAQLNGTYTKFSPAETGGTSTSELHGQHPYYKKAYTVLPALCFETAPIILYLYWHTDRWIISPKCDAPVPDNAREINDDLPLWAYAEDDQQLPQEVDATWMCWNGDRCDRRLMNFSSLKINTFGKFGNFSKLCTRFRKFLCNFRYMFCIF